MYVCGESVTTQMIVKIRYNRAQQPQKIHYFRIYART